MGFEEMMRSMLANGGGGLNLGGDRDGSNDNTWKPMEDLHQEMDILHDEMALVMAETKPVIGQIITCLRRSNNKGRGVPHIVLQISDPKWICMDDGHPCLRTNISYGLIVHGNFKIYRGAMTNFEEYNIEHDYENDKRDEDDWGTPKNREQAIEDLKAEASNFFNPNPPSFKTGDVVTPKPGNNKKGRGKPHIVVETYLPTLNFYEGGAPGTIEDMVIGIWLEDHFITFLNTSDEFELFDPNGNY